MGLSSDDRILIGEGVPSVMLYEILLSLGVSAHCELPCPQEIQDLAELINIIQYTRSGIFQTIYDIVNQSTSHATYVNRASNYGDMMSPSCRNITGIYYMYRNLDPDLYIDILRWLSNLTLLKATMVVDAIRDSLNNGKKLNMRAFIREHRAADLINRDSSVTIP